MRAVASGVGDFCRWGAWLLKYNINVLLSHIGNRVHRAFLHFSVISVPSVACIKILSSPHPILTLLHFPAAPHSPLTCAALPPLNRPPISGAAYRVWMLMRRAWVGKGCVQTVASGVGDCCRWRAWLLKYNMVLMRRAWVGKWCVRAVASGVGDCCRWQAWLLKYTIYEIIHHKGRKVKVTMSLRTLRPLR